jgi:hypothetical protein
MISSRKADNVSQTVDDLKKLGIDVQGTVCHVVSVPQAPRPLVQSVSSFSFCHPTVL